MVKAIIDIDKPLRLEWPPIPQEYRVRLVEIYYIYQATSSLKFKCTNSPPSARKPALLNESNSSKRGEYPTTKKNLVKRRLPLLSEFIDFFFILQVTHKN